MIEQLKEIFHIPFKKYSIKNLEKEMKVSSVKEKNELIKALYELELEGFIFGDDNNMYMLFPKESIFVHGTVKKSNKNNYYIECKNGIKVFLNKNDLKVKEGDKVIAEKIKPKKASFDKIFVGKIRRIIKPLKDTENYFVKGIVRKNKNSNLYYIQVGNNEYLINNLNGSFEGDIVSVMILKNEASVINILKRKKLSHRFTYQNGKIISLETMNFPVKIEDKINLEENEQFIADVSVKKQDGYYLLTNVLKIECQNFIDFAAKSHGFSTTFSDELIEESKKITILNKEETRRDLRDLETFTIDPVNAKDLDDAVSLEMIGSHYRLYVHIADVDAFVPFNTIICNEALKRGNSCYPGDTVIHQFPKDITETVCSLNPYGEKLAKTVMIDLDENGNMIDMDIFKSIIKSNKQMDYDTVNLILDENIIPSDYEPFVKTLYKMNELSKILEANRLKSGSVIVKSIEKNMLYNESGIPIKIEEKVRGSSQVLIENFMILCNKTIAEYSFWLNLPFIYRNHEAPDMIKLDTLKAKLSKFTNRVRKIYEIDNPKIFEQYFLSCCKNKTKEEIYYISQMFLSSLNRAYYDIKPTGHFGLGLKYYGTFTSPIRKGSDYINHISLGCFLDKDANKEILEELKVNIKSLAGHFTERQIEEEALEKEVLNHHMIYYAKEFLDQTLNATITFLTEDNIYIKTEENISGYIPINHGYHFNKDKHYVIGKDRIYKIADKIQVKIRSLDELKEEICFEIEDRKMKLERRNVI